VAYDLGLWLGAVEAIAALGEEIEPDVAASARASAEAGRRAIRAGLWRGDWSADYVRSDGSAEEHLALDAFTLIRHDALEEPQALTMLEAARWRLESRRNSAQPYGDFGMLNVFPPYARPGELRAKSAFPYRYHNGAEWPWLDGLYAGERLRRGLSGWRYPLTRWWQVSLQQGWPAPVEYFSPPFGRGSPLQGWSSLPAAVALAHAEQVLGGDPAEEQGEVLLADRPKGPDS
jgi:hypothetical protein